MSTGEVIKELHDIKESHAGNNNIMKQGAPFMDVVWL